MVHLVERFQLFQRATSLRTAVDGYALLSDAAVSIIRDGDLLSVTASAAALPSTAANSGKRKPALEHSRPTKKRRTAVKAAPLALAAPSAPEAAIQGRTAALQQASGSPEATPSASGKYTLGIDCCLGGFPCGCRSIDWCQPVQAMTSRTARQINPKRAEMHAGKLPRGGCGGRASCLSERSGGKQSASLTAAARTADPLNPNSSAGAPAPVAPAHVNGPAPAAAVVAPVVAASRHSVPSQKHIHFEQSEEDDDKEGEPAGPVVAVNGSTSQQPAAQHAAGATAQAALLPAPTAAVSITVQQAASSNGPTPAARADTLAQVFAARGRATAAHANGRSSPLVGAGGEPDRGEQPQQDAAQTWRRKRRSVREPQVVHELLPLLQRQVQPGDVVSYKLLEISTDFTPQVPAVPHCFSATLRARFSL